MFRFTPLFASANQLADAGVTQIVAEISNRETNVLFITVSFFGTGGLGSFEGSIRTNVANRRIQENVRDALRPRKDIFGNYLPGRLLQANVGKVRFATA